MSEEDTILVGSSAPTKGRTQSLSGRLKSSLQALSDNLLEPIRGPHQLAESRLRQILGTCARSTQVDHASLRAIETEFPGEQRRPVEEAPFLSLYGWSAMAFDRDDLRVVYVLGDPEVLEPHPAPGEEEPEAEDVDERRPATWRTRIRPATRRARQRIAPQLDRLQHVFRRSGEGSETEEGGVGTESPSFLTKVNAVEPQDSQAPDTVGLSERTAFAVDRVRRAAQPVTAQLGLGEDGRGSPGAESQAQAGQGVTEEIEDRDLNEIEELVYLLAYRPDLAPLHSLNGMAQLPGDLIPLCRLRHRLEVRQGAVETMQAFSQTGVAVKVFSADPPAEVHSALETAGLGLEALVQLGISDPALNQRFSAQLPKCFALNRRVSG